MNKIITEFEAFCRLRLIEKSKIVEEKRIKSNDNNLEPSRFIDKFEVLSKLGSGGFGSVFKVKDRYNNTESALKRISLKGILLNNYE